ncbi:response regulator [Litoribacillus peritrichatus]|uniref:histidine kinase n=1 Tax=Litoribacillus peritrichatus TaxID=718191 RepID=A0ABP7MJQ5_9GAMM
MIKKPAHSISLKLLTPLFATFIVASSLLYVFFSHNVNQLLDNFVKKRAFELAELLVINIETNSSQSNLIRNLNSIGSYDDVTEIYLLDQKSQEVLASNKNRYINKHLNEIRHQKVKTTLTKALNQNVNAFTKHQESQQHCLYYYFNVISSDKRSIRPLVLVLILNERSLTTALQNFLTPLVLSQIAALVLFAAIFYFATRLIVIGPINKLLSAIAIGRTQHKAISVKHDSFDELGVLISEYNELMTSLHSYQSELILAKEKSDDAAKAKSEFLATMTHELRTPLNGVIGMSDLLSREVIDEQQKYYVDTINNSGTQLLAIINDILDFSKIESGNLELSNIVFDLDELIQQTCSVLEFQAKKKNLHLTYINAFETTPDTVCGDDVRLRQVLINLIGNAIKFTEQGGVTVTLSAANQEALQTTSNDPATEPNIEETLAFSITVKDTGIGLSQDQISGLFNSFSQADSSTTRRFGGTGLGLAISKKICNKMGGEISVSSEEHRGSAFTILLTLPRILHDKATQPTQQPSQQPDVDNSGATSDVLDTIKDPVEVNRRWQQSEYGNGERQANVLIVDDTFINLEIAATLLENEGMNIITASDGLDALDVCSNNHFDVILMDCLMPNMDGFQATEEIRKIELLSHEENGLEELPEELPRTPIIALTASALQETKDKCNNAGMDDFVPKPFNSEQLITTVKWWLLRTLS